MTTKPLIIGRTNYRNIHATFGIKQPDRFSHIYLIGKTGTGKTTLLENLILQDIRDGKGLAFFDPHGDSVEKIYSGLNRKEKAKVIFFDVLENQEGLGYNPIRPIREDKRPLADSGILKVFNQIYLKLMIDDKPSKPFTLIKKNISAY